MRKRTMLYRLFFILAECYDEFIFPIFAAKICDNP